MKRQTNYKWKYDHQRKVTDHLRDENKLLRQNLEAIQAAHAKAIEAWIYAEDRLQQALEHPAPAAGTDSK